LCLRTRKAQVQAAHNQFSRPGLRHFIIRFEILPAVPLPIRGDGRSLGKFQLALPGDPLNTTEALGNRFALCTAYKARKRALSLAPISGADKRIAVIFG
jgi:hypothetical protein